MNGWMRQGLVLTTVLLQICHVCWSEVTVALLFKTYKNSAARDHEGKKCDFANQCDHFFLICVDKFDGDVNNIRACQYSSQKTGKFDEANEITFTQDMHTVQNPIKVLIPNDEPGVLLKVFVYDDDSDWANPPDPVDYFHFSYEIEEMTGEVKNGYNKDDAAEKVIIGTRHRTHAGLIPTSLTIEFSAYCAPPYFVENGECSKYCKPRRSHKDGFYTCDKNGDKVCRKGWVDVKLNCTTAEVNCLNHQCLNGGVCIGGRHEFKCDCPLGYMGRDCNKGGPNPNLLTPQSQSSVQQSDNTGMLVGLLVGLFLLIIIIVLILVLLLRERRKRRILKEQGTSATVNTMTMGQQTGPMTTDSSTGSNNLAYLTDSATSPHTYDNVRNQLAAQTQTANTATANGVGPGAGSPPGAKAMEASLLSPPPYRETAVPIEAEEGEQYNNPTYGAAAGASNGVNHIYDVPSMANLAKRY